MRKVFIDGGARVGESVEFLLDKREDLKGCDVYFFECNPEHKKTLEGISATNKDYNFIVRDEALWTSEGTKNFYISNDRWGDLGCTLDPYKLESLDRENILEVKTISLSDFINSLPEDAYIVLKLDVEGSEYEIINDLLQTGSFKRIKELYVEWHDHFFLYKTSHKLKKVLEQTHIKCHHDWV